MKAFNRLSSQIQKQLYNMAWTQLRGIQVNTINAVMDGKKNILISAKTAGGKTEAAFLPIISKIYDDNLTVGIKALYIGPLKALINDQFARLEELCNLSEIVVNKWHGDVEHSKKKNLVKQPSGILLITPESLESLFINHSQDISTLFQNLSFIVIDELHAFMGTERGMQLQSLISRVIKNSKKDICKIGLSATFGEDAYFPSAWLCPDNPNDVNVVLGKDEKNIKFLLKGYFKPIKDVGEKTEDDLLFNNSQSLAEDIISQFYAKTALIFADSKTVLEDYADFTSRLLESKKVPNTFRIHHGSLSKSERESTEEALKSNFPVATFCSSTLELGIDVGNVESVGQIGCPWSVSSLTQRLGRSGRKDGTSSIMIMFIEENTITSKTMIAERLFPKLLQSIASFELMLNKWCEPLASNKLYLSTMIQQIMSVIAEKGGISISSLYDNLIIKGAFRHINKDIFLSVLKSLGDKDIIEQISGGDVILGIKGEKITRFYDFYSAFKGNDEMEVINQGILVGTIAYNPVFSIGTYLILAARRWKIIDVLSEEKKLLVEPAKGKKLPSFSSCLGTSVHQKIREKMKYILNTLEIPKYLNSTAQKMLVDARTLAKDLHIFENDIIYEGRDIIIFTWTSSKINTTIWGLTKHFAKMDVTDIGIGLIFNNTTLIDIKNKFKYIIDNCPDPIKLATLFPLKPEEKHTYLLSDDLKNLEFANNFIDIDGALNKMKDFI